MARSSCFEELDEGVGGQGLDPEAAVQGSPHGCACSTTQHSEEGRREVSFWVPYICCTLNPSFNHTHTHKHIYIYTHTRKRHFCCQFCSKSGIRFIHISRYILRLNSSALAVADAICMTCSWGEGTRRAQHWRALLVHVEQSRGVSRSWVLHWRGATRHSVALRRYKIHTTSSLRTLSAA
jgi:hypothetical protein